MDLKMRFCLVLNMLSVRCNKPYFLFVFFVFLLRMTFSFLFTAVSCKFILFVIEMCAYSHSVLLRRSNIGDLVCLLCLYGSLGILMLTLLF